MSAWRCQPAPGPEEVYWPNLGYRLWERSGVWAWGLGGGRWRQGGGAGGGPHSLDCCEGGGVSGRQSGCVCVPAFLSTCAAPDAAAAAGRTIAMWGAYIAMAAFFMVCGRVCVCGWVCGWVCANVLLFGLVDVDINGSVVDFQVENAAPRQNSTGFLSNAHTYGRRTPLSGCRFQSPPSRCASSCFLAPAPSRPPENPLLPPPASSCPLRHVSPACLSRCRASCLPTLS